MARPYAYSRPSIVNGRVNVGDWECPNDVGCNVARFVLTFEESGRGIVSVRTWRPEYGDNSELLKAPSGVVRVDVAAWVEHGDPKWPDERGWTMYEGGVYTDTPARSEWTTVGAPAPEPPKPVSGLDEVISLLDAAKALWLASESRKRVLAANPRLYPQTKVGQMESKMDVALMRLHALRSS